MYFRNDHYGVYRSLITAAVILLLAVSVGCDGGGGMTGVLDAPLAPDTGMLTEEEVSRSSLDEVLAEIEVMPAPRGVDSVLFDELKAELQRVMAEGESTRYASAAPGTGQGVVKHLAPLESTSEVIRLCWLERNRGDYNLDGEVNISDLSELARRFGQPLNDGQDDAQDSQIDGNEDGVIDIADVTPIGQNFLRRISAYKVYRKEAFADTLPDEIGVAERSKALKLPGAGCVYRFTDTDVRAKTPYEYFVRPMFDGQEGAPSKPLVVWPGSSYGMGKSEPKARQFNIAGESGMAVADELIAVFEPETSEDEILRVVYQGLGGRLLGRVSRQSAYRVAIMPFQADIEDILNDDDGIKALPYLELQLDWLKDKFEGEVKTASLTYSDPFVSQQWGLDAVDAETAWDYARGGGMVIGVVDSGIHQEHEDLTNQIHDWVRIAPNEWDHITGEYDEDFDGHGTQVTGVMVMVGDNGVGGVGVAPGARVFMAKAGDWFADGEGGHDWRFPHTQVADAIGYLVDSGEVDVINLSLGGNMYDVIIENAVNDAMSNDIVVVAAAGNDNEDDYTYPAHYYGVVCVGAIDDNLDRWEWDADRGSNYGNWVKICAPGDDVFTTAHDGSYSEPTGTSFAAPMVAAGAALVRDLHPGWSQSDVRQWLYDTARYIPTDEEIGELLDLGNAMEASYDEQDIDIYPSLMYDELSFGQCAYQYLQIHNAGDLTLNWTLAFYGTDVGLNISADDYYGEIVGGDTEWVKLSYAAPNYSGAFETLIHLTSNDPDEPLLEASFRLVVTGPDIALSDDYLYFELTRGDIETQYFDVLNEGNGELEFSFEYSGDFLSASVVSMMIMPEEISVDPGDEQQMRVRIDTDGLIGGNIAGSYVGLVTINSNDPDEPAKHVTVEYDIHDSTNDAHAELDTSARYHEVSEGLTPSRFIEITNTGSTELEWHVLPQGTLLSFPVHNGSIAAGETYLFEYVIDGNQPLGSYYDTLAIEFMEFMPRQVMIDVTVDVVESGGPPNG